MDNRKEPTLQRSTFTYPNLAVVKIENSNVIILGNVWGQNSFFWKGRTNSLLDKVILGRPLYLAASDTVISPGMPMVGCM